MEKVQSSYDTKAKTITFITPHFSVFAIGSEKLASEVPIITPTPTIVPELSVAPTPTVTPVPPTNKLENPDLYVPKLNLTSITLKKGQSTTAVKVKNVSGSFRVENWYSKNTSIAKVNKSGKITAGKKTGTTVITVVMSNGKNATIKVKVQKQAVKTKGLSGLAGRITIQKGKTARLKPVRKPVTSLEKITYSSSNKKVATVSSKGVIKGRRKGKAVITVKSGKVKKKVTVVVK